MSPARSSFEAARRRAVASLCDLMALFDRWVKLPARFGNGQRERLYPPHRTFWLFLAQVLDADSSCRAAVQRLVAWRAAVEGVSASPRTGSYCTARARLPEAHLDALHAPTLRRLQALEPGPPALWCGRRVKVVDGSSVSMPDTPGNQAAYPQPSSQKAGCGFPVMRVVALFSLETGLWLKAAHGPLGVDERTLFRRLWRTLRRDDVWLGDRGFCSYADFARLKRRGVDGVTRNHARRRTDGQVLHRWGKNERLVRWPRPAQKPAYLSEREWERLPASLDVREIRVHVEVPGFRTRDLVLVTTLRDRKAFPARAFAELYRRRWLAELFLRDVKVTLGMEPLRCLSPAMVRKELSVYRLGYNLVRALMLEAARAHGLNPLRLSFKAACVTVRHWAPVLALPGVDAARHEGLYPLLLLALARDALPDRPDRCEPRARKRRPKNYPLLTKPRHQFEEIPHRNRYTKP